MHSSKAQGQPSSAAQRAAILSAQAEALQLRCKPHRGAVLCLRDAQVLAGDVHELELKLAHALLVCGAGGAGACGAGWGWYAGAALGSLSREVRLCCTAQLAPSSPPLRATLGRAAWTQSWSHAAPVAPSGRAAGARPPAPPATHWASRRGRSRCRRRPRP